MKNPLTALARLFRRDQSNAVTSQLFANAIGQPLFVHPAIGAQIIAGYLQGAVDARPSTMVIRDVVGEQRNEMGAVTSPARQVAVINVSGGLVNRMEPGECDPGPLSYQELRMQYDRALANPQVEKIVLRAESPGGMGSGMLDFADYVYANRNAKPTICVIDDYAYSAAYGIAAACSEIWITRTGGAGSVGVIGYHYDQSKFDANIGLKVTAIFSGAHKNDFSPHAELPDEQRQWLQGRMDVMRQMFAESVAKYRGMTTEAVLATEAQVYQGQAAIDVGFADRLGTFADLMGELTAQFNAPGASSAQPAMSAKAAAQDIQPSASKLAVDIKIDSAELAAQLDLAAAVTAVMSADIKPDLRAALLDPAAKITADTVADRLTHAQAVADLCVATVEGGRSLAADFITKNTSLDVVRSQLSALKLAADGPELNNSPPQNATLLLNRESIFARRRNAEPASAHTNGAEKNK